jgi:thiosulfate reductase/polysulfide reductase chain A
MMNMPNSKKTAEMLKKMELVVTIDTMPSDTVMYADVVLPEATYLERTDPVKTFAGIEPSIAQRNKVIEPMFETKPVMEIMRGLTEKISRPLWEITKKHDGEVQDSLVVPTPKVAKVKTENNATASTPSKPVAPVKTASQIEEELYEEFDLTLPFKHSQEEVNEHMVKGIYGEEAVKALKEHGVFYPDMEKLYKETSVNEHQYYPENKKYYSVNGGKPKTKSKKVECNISNLASKGVDAMPVWRDEYNFKVEKGKFRLLTGRHAQFTQSGTSNNAMLRDLIMENYLWINRRVAKIQGIKFGDKVEVSSRIGSITIKAYPTEKIAPHTLFFVHGFGEESEALTWAYKNGGNDNAIIEDVTEPVYGAASMHETNVEIRKV